MNKQNIERMARAWQEVTENKFVIPEEIPANERTAFHGAAAAASKAGKKAFSFAGKTHPVTMKKDTANAIADQKEGVDEGIFDKIKSMTPAAKAAKKAARDKKAIDDLGNSIVAFGKASGMTKVKKNEGYYKDMEIKKQDKEMGAKEVPAKKKKNGETATMNPKMDTAKSGSKGSEMEQKESRIRTALKSVLSEKENHSPNKDKAEKPEDALHGAGAKQMKKDLEGPTVDIEKKSHDDAAAAGRAGPSTKMRSNDNKQGDKKVVKGDTPMKNENVNVTRALKAAYASMYEEDGNVTTRHDVQGKDKAGVMAHIKKHAGGPVTVKHHGMTDNNDHDVSVTGHPKHVMKFVNKHEGEKYSHDHAGHAQYKKDFD